MAREVTFTIYGQELRSVETFKYLGCPMSCCTDNDAAAVFQNISSLARKKWAMCRRILARDDVTPQISGMFYKAIVQTVVLLFSSETWVVTPTLLLQQLESFHHVAVRQITGKRATLDVQTGVWKWPPLEGAMALAGGVKPISSEYIRVRQDTIAQYVATHPIMDMCNLALIQRGNTSSTRTTYWWTQSGVYEARHHH